MKFLKCPGEDARPAVGSKRDDHPIDEQNILGYIANEFPHLESWERKIINMFCDQAQYFHPQILTKVMNEGLATYTHYKIMNDLHDLNLISDGMMLEFLASHTSVVFQPDFNDPRYSGINPYYLGFKMFMDIERMCTEPTEEDRKWFGEKKWFPAVGEKADYMAVIMDAAFNYKDETFIYQFLSPKLMRDMNLFVVRDDDQEPYMEVTAIPDDGYYKKLRADLAGQYDPARRVPDIRVHAYDEEGDRTLMLRHNMINRKPLDKATAEEVLKHINGLLKHPVVLASFDEDGKIASNTLECGALTCPSPLTVARPSPIYNFLHPPSPSP